MPSINDVFSGDSLKAADLKGREHTLVIATVERIEFKKKDGSPDPKLKLSFQGARKTFVCNKTNSRRIAKLYGEDYELWPGREIVLYPDMVDFQGEEVEAIRVRGPVPQQPQQQQNGPRKDVASPALRQQIDQHAGFTVSTMKPADVPPPNDFYDDEIPF